MRVERVIMTVVKQRGKHHKHQFPVKQNKTFIIPQWAHIFTPILSSTVYVGIIIKNVKILRLSRWYLSIFFGLDGSGKCVDPRRFWLCFCQGSSQSLLTRSYLFFSRLDTLSVYGETTA